VIQDTREYDTIRYAEILSAVKTN